MSGCCRGAAYCAPCPQYQTPAIHRLYLRLCFRLSTVDCQLSFLTHASAPPSDPPPLPFSPANNTPPARSPPIFPPPRQTSPDPSVRFHTTDSPCIASQTKLPPTQTPIPPQSSPFPATSPSPPHLLGSHRAPREFRSHASAPPPNTQSLHTLPPPPAPTPQIRRIPAASH